jgi:hypothetical protein
LEIDELMLKKICMLSPVLFSSIQESNNTKQNLGLIAEELAELFPELAIYDSENQPFAIRYDLLSVLAVAAIKQLKTETDEKYMILADRLQNLEQIISQKKF